MSVLAEAVVRLRRRALGGSPGAPSTMRSTEIAYNEVDNILYVGVGDDGDGNALSAKAVTGSGSFIEASSPPAIPTQGQRWLDTSTGLEYTWFTDTDSGQWIEI